MNIMQTILRILVRGIVRLLCRLETEGLERLPQSGMSIVTANHLGRLDALLIYALLRRTDVIVAIAEKYQRYAIVRWLARQVNAIFIERFNNDTRTLRIILRRLQQGEILVIAPEGTRSKTEALLPAHPGAAYLAAKTGAPVYPVAVTGTEDRLIVANLKRLRRSHVTVRVGEPFTIPPLEAKNRTRQLQEASDEIMCHIAALLPEKYRGVYAEHPRLQKILQSKP